MKRDGQPVAVHVYPGAYHDFDNTRVYFKYFPGAATLRDCPKALLDVRHDKHYRLPGGEKCPSVQAMDAKYKRCIGRGVSAGASPALGKSQRPM